MVVVLHIVEVVVSVVVLRVVSTFLPSLEMLSQQLGGGCRGGIDINAYYIYISLYIKITTQQNTTTAKNHTHKQAYQFLVPCVMKKCSLSSIVLCCL